MLTPLAAFFGLVATGIIVVAAFVARAPAGYQDKNGFHLGDAPDEND